MNNQKYEKEKSRWIKEFVYEQWRKALTISIVNSDVNRNDSEPSGVTNEKIRTVFNNGYKLGLLQTKRSLMIKMSEAEDEKTLNLLEKLFNEIDDRLETQKCFTTYKKSYDESLISEAMKREDEFLINHTFDVTEWGDRRM